jgi:hypothetical protein
VTDPAPDAEFIEEDATHSRLVMLALMQYHSFAQGIIVDGCDVGSKLHKMGPAPATPEGRKLLVSSVAAASIGQDDLVAPPSLPENIVQSLATRNSAEAGAGTTLSMTLLQRRGRCGPTSRARTEG